uniref:CBS domain-containing protein n=1 Tax=uncultured marine thaumarchaeote KM3_100_D10 TaxID=1455979 RepID=A0A075G5J6_9ARCH|nr:CBS domain-containing protein [uncultured marine thaumarchaeote KM3_100_D10]
MTKKFKEILVSPQTQIKDVLEIINQAPHNNLPSGIALIVNGSNSLLGIVTDGDIRRALLENHNLNETVDVIMNKSPLTIHESDSTGKSNASSIHTDKLKTINHNILIVNDDNQVVDIVNKLQLVQKIPLLLLLLVLDMLV